MRSDSRRVQCLAAACAVRRVRRLAGRGLTLLELVVVMGVLVALAAVLVPLMPNMLRRAHKATDATQSSELAKAIQLCQATTYSYPDRWDSLTDANGNFPLYLPGSTSTTSTNNGTTTTSVTGTCGGFITAQAPTADQVAALNSVGIANIEQLASDSEAKSNTTFHPTRFPYASATPAAVKIDTTTKLAFVNMTAVAAATGSHLLAADQASDPGAQYVVFGIGPMSSMVGQFIQDAPTSAPQAKDMTPDVVYCHFGAIFKVTGKEVDSADGRAKFMCCVALEDDELEATEKDAEGYYQVSRGTN